MNSQLPISVTDIPSAVSQFVPSGSPRLDLTNAAYLIFSGLAMAGTFFAVKYGEKAIKSMARVVNDEGSRVANGVIHKLSESAQRKLGLNEYSNAGRQKVLTSAVSEWIRQGKDDATVANGIRTLALLEEPVDHASILSEYFDPVTIAREAIGAADNHKPVFRRTIEHYDTVSALVQSSEVSPTDRDKLLAALCLHLPEPGMTVSLELGSLIDTLQLSSGRLLQGLRVLGVVKGLSKIAASRPGLAAMLAEDQPVNRIFRVQSNPTIGRGMKPMGQAMLQSPKPDVVLDVIPTVRETKSVVDVCDDIEIAQRAAAALEDTADHQRKTGTPDTPTY